MARPKKPMPSCVTETIINGNNVLIRPCPICNKDIQYIGISSRWNINVAIKRNTVCNSCNEGRFHLNKTSWNKGIPMSHEAKLKNSLAKKDKHIHSSEYKDWLRECGNFSKRGKDSLIIQTLLKKQKISYTEYLNRMKDFKRYKRECLLITNRNDVSQLLNFNKRGKSGVAGAYHLDHIISIKEGFDNGIIPALIGNINNLQFIPWEENIQKALTYKKQGFNGHIK